MEAPFSCDLTSPTAFMLVKRKPDIEALKAARREEKRKSEMLQAVVGNGLLADGGCEDRGWLDCTSHRHL